MPDIDACKNLVFSHHILLVPTSASGVRAEQSRFHRVKARDQYSTMSTEVSDANVSPQRTNLFSHTERMQSRADAMDFM